MRKFGKVLVAFVVSWKVVQYVPAVCPQPCQEKTTAWLPSQQQSNLTCFEMKGEKKMAKFKTKPEALAFEKTMPANTETLRIFDVTLDEHAEPAMPPTTPKKGEVKK